MYNSALLNLPPTLYSLLNNWNFWRCRFFKVPSYHIVACVLFENWGEGCFRVVSSSKVFLYIKYTNLAQSLSMNLYPELNLLKSSSTIMGRNTALCANTKSYFLWFSPNLLLNGECNSDGHGTSTFITRALNGILWNVCHKIILAICGYQLVPLKHRYLKGNSSLDLLLLINYTQSQAACQTSPFSHLLMDQYVCKRWVGKTFTKND